MRRGSDIALIVLGALALIGVGASAARLLNLRVSDGHIYAPYSSFRTDPLGSKGIFVSLDRVGAADVSRQTTSWARLEGDPGTTMIILGVKPWDYVDRPAAATLERFMRAGGRLVVALDPAQTDVSRDQNWDKKDQVKTDKEKTNNDEEEKRWAGMIPMGAGPWGLILKEWGASAKLDRTAKKDDPAILSEEFPRGDLPAQIAMRGSVGFEAKSDWRPVYLRGNYTVALERPFGKGSVALLSDTSLFSNENLAAAPEPAVIAWALGPAERIVFDEHHLGVTRNPNVMTLVRQYGLHWAFLPLAVLGLLFIWRSASPLAPRDMSLEFAPTREETDSRDSFEGLVNLLRRNIPEKALLQTCMDEWKKTDQARRPDRARHITAMERIARGTDRPPRGEEIPAAYNEMARLQARGR